MYNTGFYLSLHKYTTKPSTKKAKGLLIVNLKYKHYDDTNI